jgi:hypothetical protein
MDIIGKNMSVIIEYLVTGGIWLFLFFWLVDKTSPTLSAFIALSTIILTAVTIRISLIQN